MRLTSDMALVEDSEYRRIVQQFANDQEALDTAFANAWFKLVTNGGRWSPDKRCVDATHSDRLI